MIIKGFLKMMKTQLISFMLLKKAYYLYIGLAIFINCYINICKYYTERLNID